MVELVRHDVWGCTATIEHGFVTNWKDDKNLGWGTSCFTHGCSSVPQSESRANDANHIWDVQPTRHVRGVPDYFVSVRFGAHDWHCVDPRRCVAHWVGLRRLHSTSRHPSLAWPRSYGALRTSTLGGGTVSPHRRGRLFMMSKSNNATLVGIRHRTRIDRGTDKEKTCMLSNENITTVGAERFHSVDIIPAKFHWQLNQRMLVGSDFLVNEGRWVG